MKVTVFGAGAIGSMFGGLIQHHSPETEVVLVARGEHLRRIGEQGGVQLIGPWGKLTADAKTTSNPDAVAGSDFVLLTVKSYSTHEAMTLMQPYLGEATVISIQNGINQSTLQTFLPPSRLVMGMTATSIALTEPGTVELRRNGMSVVGPSSTETPAAIVQSAADVLRLSRLPINVDSNVVGAQYNKLIFNTLGVASSLTDSSLIPEAILNARWRNHVALPLQQEALRILQSANIPLSNVPDGANVWKFRRLLRMMNMPLIGGLVRRIVAKMFDQKPIRFSFGEDLRRGKPTEIQYINGEMVRLANEAGISAPCNAKILELVDQFGTQKDWLTLDELSDLFENL